MWRLIIGPTPKLKVCSQPGLAEAVAVTPNRFRTALSVPMKQSSAGWWLFFFLRHIKGVEYRPDRAYQGVFVDVPPTFDHQGALWIEELDQMDITLASDDCPAFTPERRFCPNLPVKRGDFVRYLAQLQQWDLSAPAIQVFEDVPTDAPSARAVAYLWQKGNFDKTDPTCPDNAIYRRFCPNAPLRRASAAVIMSRALGLIE